jgi:glycosyltransferase involved in cell wall biosynthesis
VTNGRPTVLHAITNPTSTVLMRGQLAWLKTNGFDPALLCSPGQELERIGAEEGFPVFAVPMKREISPLSDLLSFLRIVRLLRRIRPLISNSGTPKAGLLVGLAAWFTRVPCRVYTLRGLRLETAKGLKKMLLTVTEKFSCFTAQRVICVSASLRDRAVGLKLVSPHKTALLGSGSSNGVDSSRFAPAPEKIALAAALRRKLGIRPEQPVIGFAGRLTRDKGISELVMAFQSVRVVVPDAVLLLVGDYEEGDPVSDNIKETIESDPAIHCVAFNSSIELYYLVMNLFVLPTHREGFPNAVLEAQASALPVITTVATGAVDAIEDGVTGLLVPVSAAGKLTAALLSLLSDPNKMQSMGRLGRERILREFRNEIVWDALRSLYESLLQEHGFRRPADSCVEAP